MTTSFNPMAILNLYGSFCWILYYRVKVSDQNSANRYVSGNKEIDPSEYVERDQYIQAFMSMCSSIFFKKKY